MQADILDLGQLNKQFDIIESGGVLHHMDDPMAGWKVLTDCLKLGGLMKIGLYSELARQHIVKTRKEISKVGIGSSHAAMRSFRDVIIESNQDHHKLITISPDFYSFSTLRDLLFHVQEHRFTIPQIQDHLFRLRLRFCGFESDEIVSHFKQTNTHKNDPYDLDKWQEYEEVNPIAFGGMYQFWCQKI
jgi:SAM-dependent methyltransferase